jgi:hypothetical protein
MEETPAPLQRQAPASGLRAFLVWSIVLVLLLGGLPSQLPDMGKAGRIATFVLWGVATLVALFFAQRAYLKAQRTMKATPETRGGWLVENLWWLILGGMVAIPAAGAVLAWLVLKAA